MAYPLPTYTQSNLPVELFSISDHFVMYGPYVLWLGVEAKAKTERKRVRHLSRIPTHFLPDNLSTFLDVQQKLSAQSCVSNMRLSINVSVLPCRTHLENNKTRFFMSHPVTRKNTGIEVVQDGGHIICHYVEHGLLLHNDSVC